MAIYSAVPPPPELAATSSGGNATAAQPSSQPHPGTATSPVDIDAWTVNALQALSVSPVARGVGSPLSIPIDGGHATVRKVSASKGTAPTDGRTVAFARPGTDDHPGLPVRPPSRRDSQVRRDALLKGKEGSRQRRRWENDRLMHVPNAQPPQPSDWEVRPTHPIHHIPYQLAQYWDLGVRQRVEAKTTRLQAARKTQQLRAGSATGLGAGQVPRDLREAAKRSPAVKGWTRALEEPVRRYLDELRRAGQAGHSGREDDTDGPQSDDSATERMDSDDEEIVFVGRDGAMRELREKRERWKVAHREVSQKMVDSGVVFDSLGCDETAAVKRWLVHTISDYYGLESRSVTLAGPSRRVVYVGLKQMAGRPAPSMKHLPRPIWEVC